MSDEHRYRTARGRDPYVCHDCGALVWDTEAHDDWHARIDEIAAAAGLTESETP